MAAATDPQYDIMNSCVETSELLFLFAKKTWAAKEQAPGVSCLQLRMTRARVTAAL